MRSGAGPAAVISSRVQPGSRGDSAGVLRTGSSGPPPLSIAWGYGRGSRFWRSDPDLDAFSFRSRNASAQRGEPWVSTSKKGWLSASRSERLLGEIPAREDALRQCFAVLRPGGRLSVTELFPDPHFLSRRKVRELAEEAGFRHEATQGHALFFTANFLKPSGVSS